MRTTICSGENIEIACYNLYCDGASSSAHLHILRVEKRMAKKYEACMHFIRTLANSHTNFEHL